MDKVFGDIGMVIFDQVLQIRKCERKLKEQLDLIRSKLQKVTRRIVKVTYKNGDVVVLQIIDGEIHEGPGAFMYHIDTLSLTVGNSSETGPGLKKTKGIVILNFVESIEVTELTTLEEAERLQFTICLHKMTEQEKLGQG